MGERITAETEVMPNTKKEWRGGRTGEIFYARAKVAFETLAHGYQENPLVYHTLKCEVCSLGFLDA